MKTVYTICEENKMYPLKVSSLNLDRKFEMKIFISKIHLFSLISFEALHNLVKRLFLNLRIVL